MENVKVLTSEVGAAILTLYFAYGNPGARLVIYTHTFFLHEV